MKQPVDISSLNKHLDFGYFNQSIRRYALPKRSINDRLVAWNLSKDYYDGSRSCGYGGFIDDGRWLDLLPKLLSKCQLNYANSPIQLSLLDIGCKKGFIVDAALSHNISAIGVENHLYPLNCSKTAVRHRLLHSSYNNLPFVDSSFDLAIAFSSIYMQSLGDVVKTLQEMIRVSTQQYVTLAAYNHAWEREVFNDWTLLGTTCLHISDWLSLFDHIGYSGYYFFTTPSVLGFTP